MVALSSGNFKPGRHRLSGVMRSSSRLQRPTTRGNLEELAGEVVLSVLAPEELARHAHEVQRVIGRAQTGPAPLVIVVEAAEELHDHQVAPSSKPLSAPRAR